MNGMILRGKNCCFQHRVAVLMMPALLCFSAGALTAPAQQSTVTAVTGTLLVNGRDAAEEMRLTEGMVLETLVDETAIVELSDGSQLEIGEQTRLSVAKTIETAAATHIIRLNLAQGWTRVKAAQEMQGDEGFIFDVETPNAVVGAKLAKANFEVGYEKERQETVGIAHGVELRAKNLLSGEERYIPQGSTVLIQAENMELIEGADRSKSSDNVLSRTMDKLTNPTTLIVAGGLVGAAAITAALVKTEDEVTDSDFVGNFERTDTIEGGDVLYEQISIQDGQISDLMGFYHVTRNGSDCQYEYTRDFTGSVDVNTGFLTLAPVTYTEQCQSGPADVTLSTETWTCKLRNEKTVLRCTNRDGNQIDYQRQ